jgi:PII-like signaling protein
MRFEGEGKLLRIFIGESDRFEGKPLYEAIVLRAREEGLAGATVLRGIEGFGASSHIHTSRILRLSEDLPIVIEIADTVENIDRVLPMFDEMVGDGMMTLERVEVLTYRGGHRRRSDDVVADRLRMLAAAAEAARLEDPSEGAIVTRVGASIRAAHDYGASVAEIAETTGLPESEVERVLGETG